MVLGMETVIWVKPVTLPQPGAPLFGQCCSPSIARRRLPSDVTLAWWNVAAELALDDLNPLLGFAN